MAHTLAFIISEIPVADRLSDRRTLTIDNNVDAQLLCNINLSLSVKGSESLTVKRKVSEILIQEFF